MFARPFEMLGEFLGFVQKCFEMIRNVLVNPWKCLGNLGKNSKGLIP